MTDIRKGMAAGFAATLVLSALMLANRSLGLVPQADLVRILGVALGTAESESAGWIAHFAIGTLLWGTLFARLAPYLPGQSHAIRGVVFGLHAWMLMMIALMPVALFGLRVGVGAQFVLGMLHVVYGGVLGAVYGVLASRQRRARKRLPRLRLLSAAALAES
ncbi:MAG: hypothetical protein M3145_13725 [Pseudomonadota bacterium]|nr:hypothetical protein [Pseudomonadota bacterium]